MERQTWIFLAAALAIVGLGAATLWGDPEHEGTGAADEDTERPRGRASHGSRGATGASVGRGDETSPRADPADPLAQVPRAVDPRVGEAPADEVPGAAAAETPELPGEAAEASQSSGWRLGATRRRIEMLTPRIARLEAVVAELEAGGQPEQAARQQRVIDRLAERLGALREEEPQLLGDARGDGSLADEAAGYEAAEAAGRAQGARSAVAEGR